MKVNYKRLELKLRKIVERRLREGFDVSPGMAFHFSNDCKVCAVGSVIAGEGEHVWSQLETISSRLGISANEALAISDGFEGLILPRSKSMPELHAIGAAIRRDYCEFEDAS